MIRRRRCSKRKRRRRRRIIKFVFVERELDGFLIWISHLTQEWLLFLLYLRKKITFTF